LNHCSTCGREIPDSTTICDECSRWAAESVGAPPSKAVAAVVHEPPPVAAAAPATVRASAGRRKALVIALAVLGCGVMAFPMLMRRGTSAVAPAPDVRTSPPVSASPATVRPSSIGPKWNPDNRAYWLGTQRRGAAFEVLADNVVSTWQGPSRPTLVVRCMSRKLETFVFTQSAMKIEPQPGKMVTVSFDEEPARTERWLDSDDHDALFAPDGVAFVQRVARARSLAFGYTPHNSPSVVARFQVNGLHELIVPAAKECGWTE
jgi:Type VI secretion system VasI, EvfG, VC_A0118